MLSIGVLGDENYLAISIIKDALTKNKIKFHCVQADTKDKIRHGLMEGILKKSEVLIIDIKTKEDFEKLQIIGFDVLIFMTNTPREEVDFKTILKEKSYLIINNDIPLPKIIRAKNETVLVTCGFNHTSTVTVSSVWENKKIECYFQRELRNMKGKIIIPQEVVCKREFTDQEVPVVLAAISAVAIVA